MTQCVKCKRELESHETYEYRGALACEDCFDDVITERDRQRREIMAEEDAKTKVFNGLDLGNSAVGKENRTLLKGQIEIASKESSGLKQYEGRE